MRWTQAARLMKPWGQQWQQCPGRRNTDAPKFRDRRNADTEEAGRRRCAKQPPRSTAFNVRDKVLSTCLDGHPSGAAVRKGAGSTVF